MINIKRKGHTSTTDWKAIKTKHTKSNTELEEKETKTNHSNWWKIQLIKIVQKERVSFKDIEKRTRKPTPRNTELKWWL